MTGFGPIWVQINCHIRQNPYFLKNATKDDYKIRLDFGYFHSLKRLGSVTEMAVEVRQKSKTHTVNLYDKHTDVCAYDAVIMLTTLKCPVRVCAVIRRRFTSG